MKGSRQLDLGESGFRAPATRVDYSTAVAAAALYRMHSMREITAMLQVGGDAVRSAWKRYGIIPQKGQRSYQRFRPTGYVGFVLALVLSALLERDFTWLRSDTCAELCELAGLPSGRQFMRVIGGRWRTEFRKGGDIERVFRLAFSEAGKSEAAQAFEGSTRRKRRTRRHDIASTADVG